MDNSSSLASSPPLKRARSEPACSVETNLSSPTESIQSPEDELTQLRTENAKLRQIVSDIKLILGDLGDSIAKK